jgi:hypothetical protein
MVDAYNPYLVDDDEDDEEEEIAASEWNWGNKTVMVPSPWGKEVEESYDFDVTKADKLFDFLLEKGRIKLPTNHVILSLEQLKNKRFCKIIILLLILLMIAVFLAAYSEGHLARKA